MVLDTQKLLFIGQWGEFDELQIHSHSNPCLCCRSLHNSERCCRRDPISILVNPNVSIPTYFLPVGHRGHNWMVPARLS